MDSLIELVANFFTIDFGELEFASPGPAFLVGSVFLILLLAKIIFRRKKFYLAYPGYGIPETQKGNLLVNIMGHIIVFCKGLVILAAALFLLAFAEPFATNVYEMQVVKSRERIVNLAANNIFCAHRWLSAQK